MDIKPIKRLDKSLLVETALMQTTYLANCWHSNRFECCVKIGLKRSLISNCHYIWALSLSDSKNMLKLVKIAKKNDCRT